MNVAIYGDSYADWSTPYNYYSPELRDRARSTWSYLLQDHHSVVNYSLQASSLYWSLRKFEETHSLHDRVIFVVTNWGRYPEAVKFESTGDRLWGVTGLNQAEFYLGNPYRIRLTERERLCLEALRDYWIWAGSTDYEIYTHELFIKRILELRPDTIMIPIDSNNLGVGLSEYTVSSFRGWGQTLDSKLGYKPIKVIRDQWVEQGVVCHLTETEHRLALDEMLRAVRDSEWKPQIPDKIFHDEPLEHYYTRRTT